MRIVTALAAAYLLVLVGGYYLDVGSVRRHHVESAGIILAAAYLATVLGRGIPELRSTDPSAAVPRWSAVAFALLALLVYAPTLGAGLFADDFVLLDAARNGRWTVWHELFRPLIFLVWRVLDALPGGFAPAAHTLNIALHAANATMLSVLSGRLGLARWPALAAGALFVSFPGSVEAVAWPAGLQDVLMTSCLLGFLLVLTSPELTRGAAAVGLTLVAAGSLTKETGVVAPVLALLTCATLRAPRNRWLLASASAALVGVLLAVRFSFVPLSVAPVGFSRYWLKELLVRPFATLAVPLTTSESAALPWLAIALAAVPVAALGMAACRWKRGNLDVRRVLWGAAFVLVSVAPVGTAFFVSADLLGSRYLYLAAAGWSILLATVLSKGVGSRPALIALGLLAACWLAISGAHVRRWTMAADLRDRILHAASVTIGPRCFDAIVGGLPETHAGVPVFVNGFPEAMRERFWDLRIHAQPTARAECRFEWTGEELTGWTPRGHLSAGGPDEKAILTDYVTPSFMGPPPTLSEMMAAAGLVVGGRFTGARPHESGFPNVPGGDMYTAYTLRVDEVFRAAGGGEIPSELTVVRMGATRDRGSYVERLVLPEFPDFHLERRYVLFLGWNRFHDAWTPLWSPNAVFDVDGPRVEPLGRTETVEQFRNIATADFLAALRGQGGER